MDGQRADMGEGTVAIITARGGSKGLPGKNIRPLAGKPLIAWTIEAALESRHVGKVVVSTDSPEIARVARDWGAEAPFLRPAALSGDEATSAGAVLHSLDWLEREAGETYARFLLLQPTSPLRTAAHIDEAVEAFLAHPSANSLVSVCEAGKGPWWMRTVGEDGFLRDLMPDRAVFARRQDMPRVFALNGAIYLMRPEELRRAGGFSSDPVAYYVMDSRSSVDIDTEEDFLFAETLMALRNPLKA